MTTESTRAWPYSSAIAESRHRASELVVFDGTLMGLPQLEEGFLRFAFSLHSVIGARQLKPRRHAFKASVAAAERVGSPRVAGAGVHFKQGCAVTLNGETPVTIGSLT